MHNAPLPVIPVVRGCQLMLSLWTVTGSPCSKDLGAVVPKVPDGVFFFSDCTVCVADATQLRDEPLGKSVPVSFHKPAPPEPCKSAPVRDNTAPQTSVSHRQPTAPCHSTQTFSFFPLPATESSVTKAVCFSTNRKPRPGQSVRLRRGLEQSSLLALIMSFPRLASS